MALGIVLAGPPAPAFAHTSLESSTPRGGSILLEAPEIVTLRSSEKVADLAYVDVESSDGDNRLGG